MIWEQDPVHILINHLTRMQPGVMCTAGIDCQRMRHVRPVTGQQMKTEWLAVHGGPFELARVIDLGDTEFAGEMPEIEDRRFDPQSVSVVEEIPKAEFWEWNCRVAASALTDVFGPDLAIVEYGDKPATAAVPQTFGWRSLGCYWTERPSIELVVRRQKPRVRFGFVEGGRCFSVPVTDIRCYREDHVTPDEEVIRTLADHLRCHDRVLTSIGLSRAYHWQENSEPKHWLQINNIHLPPDSPKR